MIRAVPRARARRRNARRGRGTTRAAGATRGFPTPRGKHEAPRSDARGGLGTSDATRRRDASLIRPSDAFESPDRIATEPQRDRRDSARSSTPKSISRRTSAPPIPPIPALVAHRARGRRPREMRPRSSPPTRRYTWVGQARRRGVSGTTRAPTVWRSRRSSVKMDDDTLRFIGCETSPAEPETPKRGRAPRRGGGRRSETAGKETASCVVYLSRVRRARIWRVCSAPPDVADAPGR